MQKLEFQLLLNSHQGFMSLSSQLLLLLLIIAHRSILTSAQQFLMHNSVIFLLHFALSLVEHQIVNEN